MKKITIIGSGATGTLLAVNLIKHNDNQPIEINLVDKKARLGRGVAYSTAIISIRLIIVMFYQV